LLPLAASLRAERLHPPQRHHEAAMLILKTEPTRFLAALQDVLGAVERRHTLPILSNVLLRKSGATLTLTTSDLDLQLSTRAELGGDDGTVATTVAARKLADILRALPPDATASLSHRAGKLQLQAGKSRFTLHTLPAQDYPMAQEAADLAPPVALPQPLFRSLLAQVAFAMAVQDIRYYLNGVLLALDGHDIRMVATDGNRLALAQATVDADLPKTEVILPRKAVQELLRLLRDDAPASSPLQMRLAPAQARFDLNGTELVTKLIEGKYPDYRRVIPANATQQLTLPRDVLQAGLQRTALLANERFKAVTLQLEAGMLRLSASNAEHEEASEEIAVQHDGPPLQIGLNVAYVLDLLAQTHADTVTLALRDAQSAVLFTVAAQPGFCYVVSPLRI
jgi:DNA polymerase-3 subunit beta